MSKWISVKDRLPDTSKEVLVAFKCKEFLMTARYSERYKVFNANDHDTYDEAMKYAFDDVTHWMELPEPPKEEEDVTVCDRQA